MGEPWVPPRRKSPLLCQLSYRPLREEYRPAAAILFRPPPSTSGPGHSPFKAVARVRIPLGAPGRLAQLGERLPYKQEVACSSHAPPTEKRGGSAGSPANPSASRNDEGRKCGPRVVGWLQREFSSRP